MFNAREAFKLAADLLVAMRELTAELRRFNERAIP